MPTRWSVVRGGVALAVALVVGTGCGRGGFGPVSDGGQGSEGSDAMTFVDGPPCAPSPECTSSGGVCEGGGCKISPPAGGDVVCPPEGCTLRCTQPGSCTGGSITCPPGSTCIFDCSAPGSCSSQQIDCDGATCEFHCDKSNTCDDNTVSCVGGSCLLHCCGNGGSICSGNTLNGGIDVGGACM